MQTSISWWVSKILLELLENNECLLGVPRVLDNTLPKYLQYHQEDSEWKAYSDYLLKTRININVRQVFPKGFDPAMAVIS